MGIAREPAPVKLIASLFSNDETLLSLARGALTLQWGTLDYQSDLMPFDHTSYYTPEFGEGLVRQIVAFSTLVRPDQLADIKQTTNRLEMSWTVEGRRRVNIDPGYVSLGKLVLATTKDHAHRVYLSAGIYAEVTLQFHRKGFRPTEHTYPDYASGAYLAVFDDIRAVYASQLRLRGSGA
jgi:hypothetical protein